MSIDHLRNAAGVGHTIARVQVSPGLEFRATLSVDHHTGLRLVSMRLHERRGRMTVPTDLCVVVPQASLPAIVGALGKGCVPELPPVEPTLRLVSTPPPVVRRDSETRDSETKQTAARAQALKMQAEGEKPAAIVAALVGQASRAAVYRWLRVECPGFDDAWKALPPRSGNNPRDRAARAYRARVDAGATAEEILAGCRRYAAFCQATAKTGTEFVMQAATFFGPEKPFTQAWTISSAPPRWDADNDTILAEARRLGIHTVGETTAALKALIRAKHAEAPEQLPLTVRPG